MNNITEFWDETPIDLTEEANFIWDIANKLRGAYMPDKYGDVIIPMTIIRRFECTLEPSKDVVVDKFKENPTFPYKAMCRIAGFQFYNTSEFTLKELCNDPEHLAANFNSYIDGFSDNVQEILKNLEMKAQIEKMDTEGCLYEVVKAFSELDLNPATYDSVKMGHIFENLIGKFFENIGSAQHFTSRDLIRLAVSLAISEGCEDLFDDKKIVTILDDCGGSGGFCNAAASYIEHYNPTADVRLHLQEIQSTTASIALGEALIRGQNAENIRHADTLKEDCFPDMKARIVLKNSPFGLPWKSGSGKSGQEEAVLKEHAKGEAGRFPAGLPSGSDSQMLFLQSAVAKMDDEKGRAVVVSNGSPLFTGGVSSGESQIRRYLLENDLIEAIVQMSDSLFINTGIVSYLWVLSKNKRPERKGKIQLIDASSFVHKLRKPIGNKKNEITPEDRTAITKLYADFEENEYVKIFDNTEFMYREYTVMQPLQRSYSITEESIDVMLSSGALNSLYDENKVSELEEKGTSISEKDKKKLEKFRETKVVYDKVLDELKNAVSEKKYMSKDEFMPVLTDILSEATADKKLIEKIADGLSVMDKNAEIQREKSGKNKGDIIYDKSTKDTEIVKYDEDIEDYMAREVLPHIPDAKWFFEEDLTKKNPVIKTGAEIPFTRYFYKYEKPTPSDELMQKFMELENSVSERIARLMK